MENLHIISGSQWYVIRDRSYHLPCPSQFTSSPITLGSIFQSWTDYYLDGNADFPSCSSAT
ncbi:hypothetical protein [Coleofasciculus sp. G2-EDA-02]|uniref:hypothetical protein n=1 Tax=Coleofasciculus sp. G2-EDA-02 TaxID=3069529 RepID=UPI0032F1B830